MLKASGLSGAIVEKDVVAEAAGGVEGEVRREVDGVAFETTGGGDGAFVGEEFRGDEDEGLVDQLFFEE